MATKRPKSRADGTKEGLMSVGDIAKMAGVQSNTVSRWILRHNDFPKPTDATTASNLYRKSAVVRWLRKSGRG